MAYATVDDVQALAPHLPAFSPASKPSVTQVQGFISDIERGLNATLGNLGYVTPVVGPNAIAVLKDVVAHGALARVMRARAYGSNNPGDLEAAKQAQAIYDGRVKALGSSSDPFELPADAVRGTDALQKDRAGVTAVYVNPNPSTSRVSRDMVF
jgi:hypothetical protein